MPVKASMSTECPSKAVNARVVRRQPISMQRFSEKNGPPSPYAVTIPRAHYCTCSPPPPCPPKTTHQPPVQSTTRPAKHGSPKPAQVALSIPIPTHINPHPPLRQPHQHHHNIHNPHLPSNNHAIPPI